MANTRPPDSTKTFYQWEGVPLFSGDDSLSSRIRYVGAVLERVGNDQSRDVLKRIQLDVALLENSRDAAATTTSGPDGLVGELQQVRRDLVDALAKSERNRLLALSMADQLTKAGLRPPLGMSALIQEGTSPK